MCINLASDDKCTFCSNPDSTEHTFIDCTVSISFYTQALVWFNQCHGTTVILSPKQIAFHTIPPFSRCVFKTPKGQTRVTHHNGQKIYLCLEMFQKEPCLNEFIQKVQIQWKIENCAPG